MCMFDRKVYKAKCKNTQKLVALKKIRMESEKEGFPVTAAREIKLLKAITKHPNIVQLLSISASSADSVYLVFEYVDFDLSGLQLLYNGIIDIARVKCIMKQILHGLTYLHEHGVIHRDMKAANVLVTREGIVRLADFGLAKVFLHPDKPDYNADDTNVTSNNRMMTNRVITLWYRPPEVLLGAISYGPEVDMWGLGCILLDLVGGKPAFPGQDEISQLEYICNRVAPIPSYLADLPWFTMIGNTISTSGSISYLDETYGEVLGEDGLSLVKSLLNMNPKERISAKDALKHQWFTNDPIPSTLLDLIPPHVDGDWHEYECKQRRHHHQHNSSNNKSSYRPSE